MNKRQFVGFVKPEAIAEQLLRFPGPGALGIGAHDHRDQTHAVLFGGGHQAIARFLGVAGFQAVHAVVPPQQQVAVVLGDAVVTEFLLCVEIIVLRKVADNRPRQDRQVVGSGVVVVRRPAGGVHEMGIVHAQFAGLVVHQIGEGVLGAGDELGDCFGGARLAGDTLSAPGQRSG